MARLELPGGGWAEVREADQIPRGLARSYRKVLFRLAGPGEGTDAQPEVAAVVVAADGAMDTLEDMTDALVLAIVSEWSYGAVSVDVLQTVPDTAVEAIYTKAVDGGYIDKLTPDFSPSPDESSPTGPSSA